MLSQDTDDRSGHAPVTAAPAYPQLIGGYYDGRVGKPVPRKLKGKINKRNGNFSVILMGNPRPEMTERDLAAKRSSEETAAAAELANKDGYRSVKPSQLAWYPPKESKPSPPLLPATTPVPVPGCSNTPCPHPTPAMLASDRPTASPAAAAAAVVPSGSASCSPPTIIPDLTPAHRPAAPAGESATPEVIPTTAPPSRALAGLTPQQIKTEQARLLTLLRSLHPVLVVDQICKALAYFGGIPGAPAPADGAFPKSASANGPGSLFVGWVAEIFPELDAARERAIGSAGAYSSVRALSVPARRTRGRPKGSKSSKARKDKGVRKLGAARSSAAASGAAMPGLASVNEPDATQPPLANPPTDASQSNNDVTGTVQPENQASLIAQAALREQVGTDSSLTTPGSKKRGRPKGSKNKPKAKPGTNDDIAGSLEAETTSQSQHPVADSPLAHKTSTNRQGQLNHGSEGSTETGTDGIVTNATHRSTPGQVPPAEQVASSEMNSNRTREMQPSEHGSQNDKSTPNVPSRKRKKPTQTRNQATVHTSEGSPPSDSVVGQDNSSQVQRAKRRQVSKGTSQNPGLGNVELQSGAEMTTSSNLPAAGQPLTISSSLGSQSQMQSSRSNLNQMSQKQRHQQSPNTALQGSSQTLGPSPSLGRQQNQGLGAQGRPQANMVAQSFYQQQQMSTQYRQDGSSGDRFGRSMNTGQFHQNMMNPSPSLRNQPQQQPQQLSGSSNPMASFQSYSDSNYMDMDYPGEATDAAAAAAAFGGHTQLEAALREPNLRERLYHAIGRQ